MSDDTSRRRSTRRPNMTRPVERGIMGGPTAGQKLRYNPLTQAELAQIITEARTIRAEDDIQAYARRKTA